MRRRALASAAIAAMAASPAAADTLQQALEGAYRHNPTLTAQRANVRAADENVPIALAAGRPTLEGSATYQENILKGQLPPTGFFSNPDRQLVGQLNATMPLITFGAVRGAVRAAEARVEASRAGLRGTEANLFTDVVGAYMDVIRDEAIVQLNQRRTSACSTSTCAASRDRFQVGDLTRTDVAQSEARLCARARQLQSAAGAADRQPRKLHPPGRRAAGRAGAAARRCRTCRRSDDAAVTAAIDEQPGPARRHQAARRHRASTSGVARARRLPQVAAVAGGNLLQLSSARWPGPGRGNGGQSGQAATVGLQLHAADLPGRTPRRAGAPGAGVAQPGDREGHRDRARRSSPRRVRPMRAGGSSNEVIESAETAVSANRLSLEGVRAENSVGTRTILDILNAEQELLNARSRW